jgi:formate dehydrogenase maturation protein FdhE
MRQGEVAPKATWTGNPLGGVKAPEALILPDPTARFARTAARLQALSAGHPMQQWLRFMALLAQAQHAAAITMQPLAGPNQIAVDQAVDARVPPLASDRHRREATWRDGLAILLDKLHSGEIGDLESAPGEIAGRGPALGEISGREPALGEISGREPALGDIGRREQALAGSASQKRPPGPLGSRDPGPSKPVDRERAVGALGSRDSGSGKFIRRERAAGVLGSREPSPAEPGNREPTVGTLGSGKPGTATIPALARAAIADLRGRGAAAIEVLADGFLNGDLDDADAGVALFVAAALQVYFTSLAADLPAPSLRLLPQRGLCPCCGSTPISGVITASGQAGGARYLHCSLCATAWNHVRAACITCGDASGLALRGIEDDDGAVKAEVCSSCHSYAKMLYQARDMKVDPFADDLATLGLDVLVAEAGWSRHAPNPLLLIG